LAIVTVLFDAMRDDREDRPECGPTGRTLGVRLEGDIDITQDGMVEAGTGGMSVALWPCIALGTSPDTSCRRLSAGVESTPFGR